MVLAPFGRRACLVVVLSVIPASVFAQGASTATIAGIVRDPSGGVLPGVTVEAASPALIEKVRSTVTDERGQYRLPELRPGAYTLTFSLAGFSTLKRDGLELRTNFTAQIDVELTVSALQETITVSGATPLVDVQSATQQRTVTREVLDTVPTAKSVLGIAALIPAVVEPPNAQDVGGSKGERSVRITVHGGKTYDSRLLQDGMRYNALTPGIGLPATSPTNPAPVIVPTLEGTGRGYYVNPLAVEEVVVDLGTMGSAEYSLGGAQVNSIPKNGANRVTGSVFLAGTGAGLQSNNLDDTLRSQGLTTVNRVKKVYDFNGAVGGPIMRDRLWFFAAGRRWGTTTRPADLYADANTNDFIYTPDLSRPIEPEESDKAVGGRVTLQATSRDKFTFSWDKQRNFQDQLTGQLETGATKNEANQGYCQRHEVMQGTWSRPQSKSMLFDAGVTVSKFNFQGFGKDLLLSDYEGCGGQLVDNVSINDVGFGYLYNGVGVGRGMSLSHQSNGRFNVSFVTSRHSIKTGVFWMYGLGGGQRTYQVRAPSQINKLPLTYTFLSGRPTSLTQFSSPNLQVDQLNPDLALFVQDQWRLNRVTVSAGVRFEWLRESVPATEQAAGLLVAARSYPAIDNVPNWKDLNPRLGIVWDPQGDAKTAIKFGINRYVTSNTTGIATLFDPTFAGSSTGRTWTDNNNNFLPDCDLRSALAQSPATTGSIDTCGPMQNANFGTTNLTTRPDPDWVNGWRKRPYNWQTSVNIDREIVPNLVVNAGYYRTWYGNFMVVDNQRVTPADYSPFCVTVPTDSRLALSGQELCGLYDLNPNKVGQVDNLVTLSEKYGKQKEVYNGVDVNFQLRLRSRATLGGGWNIGNAVQQGTTAGGSASASTDSCYVIDSPQQLFNCQVDVPYQSRIKINGSYTFRWGIQVAAVAQSNPGANYSANLAYSSAQVQPSLGRALTSGTVTVPLAKPYTLFGPRINQLDLRGTKILRFGSQRIQANIDAYNVFNVNTPVLLFGTYNARWGQPTQVLEGRLIKFSAQIDF